jgi:hypothetical protein
MVLANNSHFIYGTKIALSAPKTKYFSIKCFKKPENGDTNRLMENGFDLL